MNEQELCKKRLMDLSRQADSQNRVIFSHFLNLNEQHIYHSIERGLGTKSFAFGGYEEAERQMIAWIPDAFVFSGSFPICCLVAKPIHPKYAGKLSHRDVLGALMHLGLDRSKIGDIICKEQEYYIFCEDDIHQFIMENLTQIGRTDVSLSVTEDAGSLAVRPALEDRTDVIASNRIDCIVAKAFHLSRSQAAQYLGRERVFIDGRCVTNGSQCCESGSIVSVRGMGRFIFETDQALNKKGRLKVRFRMYVSG